MNEENTTEDANVPELAQEIVSDGKDIQERVRTLVLNVLKRGEVRLNQISEVAADTIDGAVSALEKLSPEERSERLEKTFAGLEDAFVSTLNATELALKEAKGRGKQFVSEDLKGVVDDLQGLEKKLVENISGFAKKTESQLGDQLKDFSAHAERIAGKVRPSIASALSAAKDHPLDIAKEAGGAVAGVVAGALQAAGDILGDKKDDEDSEES